MERLTKTGQRMVWGKGHDGEHWLEPCEMSYRDMGAALRRLAEYEDTDLTPEEITALKAGLQDKIVEAIPSLVAALTENMPKLVEAYIERLAAEQTVEG